MEQPPEKRKKLKQKKSTNVNDSSYGSMITGTSSSSSLSLSLFSESDLAEAPSTSGCSSEMASAMQSKEKKKERAKEFMKKLKSMLPMKERTGKMDTLSTLEQLVNSMRQLNEEQKRQSEFKTPPPHSGSYHGNDSERLSHSNMFISVSLKNHVVQSASPALMEHLGYPVDWWKGRLLKDFLNKKDTNTVNSCVAQHSNDEDHTETSVGMPSTTGPKEGSKYFYARIRRFRKLGDGFNLHNIVSYCPFMMMITTKPIEQSDSSDDESFKHKKALTIYCQPLSSAYEEGHLAPEKWKFSLRHSLFCNFTYVHPNTVRLLGFLPQDLNGMSIFELYHPEDFHQLLEIHKKIILSMGQPFKSGTIRLRTRNGCFVEVETEWSSFINPWSKRLEFIIGQHTVMKGPSRPDLFEDLPYKPEKLQLSPEVRKIQEKILEVLKKPVQGVFAEPSPVIQSIKETSAAVQKSMTAQGASREVDTVTKAAIPTDKQKVETTTTTEGKSAVIDEKGISSIYNQLNYSHNIKRFLMSHPKSFSNVSDEESVVTREDSEDEAINDEEEMPLEIPVVKPPSCGSSTQVHVSEQGHGEEMLSPPTFGDEAMPPRDCSDNIHLLTEEALKKHTRLQERLYLQTISEEQPLLLNMRRLKSSKNTSLQKRPRPREVGEEVEVAKHPCTNSGVFRSSSNIFMQSFPAVTSCELTSVTPTSQPLYRQSEMVAPYDGRFLGQSPQIGFQPFQSGYQTGSQGSLAIPPQPTIHLVPGDSVPLSCIPTSLGPMIPNVGHYDIRAGSTGQNIQWPYYPQTGYTLMPQVMAGFYRPLLQPVQVQVQAQQGGFIKGQNVGVAISQGPIALNDGHLGKPAKKIKMDRFDKKHQDSDNPSSSMDDTTSSIMYLLEADSSTFEDSDNKASSGVTPGTKQNKRSLEPPWLRGVKWNTDTKMRYKMSLKKSVPVLKMDEKFLKKNQQYDMALLSLEQLLEDIALPDHEYPMDEEADYLLFPGDESLDLFEMDDEKTEEIDLTQSESQVVLGVGGLGGTSEDVWNLGASENDDESYDTPVNSHSEDEKSPSTPTRAETKDGENIVKQELGADLTGSKQANEEHGDVSIENVFIRSSQAAGNSPLIKRGTSPKDGSLSGDEGSGSYGGQKAEIDTQSNCSKVSSDLTPSDDRSNEEVGSSMKESDSSTKKMKGVSSVASSNSSNDHTSQEEGSGGMLAKDGEDLIKKLFVPLKVRVSRRLDTPSSPYWLVEAHLSPKVAMTYKIPTRQLEDVLKEDKRKMTDLVQSATVKQQLLQLLNEVDLKSGMTVAKTMSSATVCPASYSQPCSLTRMKQPSSLSDSAFGGTITEEEQCNTDDKMTNNGDSFSDENALKGKCILPANKSVVSTTDTSHNEGATGLTKSETKTSLCEKTSHLTLAKSTSSISMESLPGQFHAEMSCYRNHRQMYTNSSDTNTDPIVDEPRSRSFYTSQSSNADTASTVYSVRGGPSRTEAHLQEKLQALESGGNLTGQKIEDIIMNKVFVPVDTLSTNPETRPVPSIFIVPE